MPKPFRLAVLNSHPIQYFAPLYAYLNRDAGLEVTALYCSDFSLRGAVDPGFRRGCSVCSVALSAPPPFLRSS